MDRAIPIWKSLTAVWQRRTTVIAVVAVAAISVHLFLRFAFRTTAATYDVPLLATLKIFCDHIEPMAPIGEFMS